MHPEYLSIRKRTLCGQAHPVHLNRERCCCRDQSCSSGQLLPHPSGYQIVVQSVDLDLSHLVVLPSIVFDGEMVCVCVRRAHDGL